MKAVEPKKTYELKRLHEDSIDAAFEKMDHYRALNEPEQAESICRDILAVAPDLRDAKVGLLLCLADQFRTKLSVRWQEATEILETLEDEYDRAYYSGVMCERRAKAHYRRKTPQSGLMTFSWLEKAMGYYAEAEQCRPAGDDSSLLRWNTCARMIMAHDDIGPAPDDAHRHGPAPLGE